MTGKRLVESRQDPLALRHAGELAGRILCGSDESLVGERVVELLQIKEAGRLLPVVNDDIKRDNAFRLLRAAHQCDAAGVPGVATTVTSRLPAIANMVSQAALDD